jgi:SAM-dependent methyltransferase
VTTSARPHTTLFTDIDRSADPDFFIRFMDEAQRPAAIQASKPLMLTRAALSRGSAVLDVGCGPGDDLIAMVERVGPAGRLVGVDASEVMIAEARSRASHHGLPITFKVAEASHARGAPAAAPGRPDPGADAAGPRHPPLGTDRGVRRDANKRRPGDTRSAAKSG